MTPADPAAPFDDLLDDWLAHEFAVVARDGDRPRRRGRARRGRRLHGRGLRASVVRRRRLARTDPRRRRLVARAGPGGRPRRGHRRDPRTAGPRVVAGLATGPVGLSRPVLRRHPQPRHPPVVPRRRALRLRREPVARDGRGPRGRNREPVGGARQPADRRSRHRPVRGGDPVLQGVAASGVREAVTTRDRRRSGRHGVRSVPGLPVVPHRTGELGPGRLRHRRGAVLGAFAGKRAPRLRRVGAARTWPARACRARVGDELARPRGRPSRPRLAPGLRRDG